MLQRHSFFSTPLVFFGTHQNEEANEEEFLDQESIFLDTWTMSINPELSIDHHSKIGLFLLWEEPDKAE